MTAFFKKISQLVEDGDGLMSAHRLGFLVWFCGLFAVWAYLSVKKGEMSTFNDGVLTMVALVAGVKSFHQFQETPKAPDKKVVVIETGKPEDKK